MGKIIVNKKEVEILKGTELQDLVEVLNNERFEDAYILWADDDTVEIKLYDLNQKLLQVINL